MSEPTVAEDLVYRIARSYFSPVAVDAPNDDPDLVRSSKALWRIQKIVARDPAKGWALIVALAEKAPNQDALGDLGAGPVEDFVGEHGMAFLDRIHEAAARSDRVRSALTYTDAWDTVPEQVRNRLLRHFPGGRPGGAPFQVTFADAE
jgi:hypothetical protein